MNTDQHIWEIWAARICRWGIRDWVTGFLDAAGPFTLLGAQILYIAQPLLHMAVPDDQLEAFARMCEDTDQVRAFTAYLREVA